MQGTEDFLEGLDRLMISPKYDEEFGARVYKISRDAQGSRLTHMKITGEASEQNSLSLSAAKKYSR